MYSLKFDSLIFLNDSIIYTKTKTISMPSAVELHVVGGRNENLGRVHVGQMGLTHQGGHIPSLFQWTHKCMHIVHTCLEQTSH